MEECRWLKPVLVGQFEFVEWTSDGHLRHSKFVGLREDKKAGGGPTRKAERLKGRSSALLGTSLGFFRRFLGGPTGRRLWITPMGVFGLGRSLGELFQVLLEVTFIHRTFEPTTVFGWGRGYPVHRWIFCGLCRRRREFHFSPNFKTRPAVSQSGWRHGKVGEPALTVVFIFISMLPSRRQLAYLSCESRTSPAFKFVFVFMSMLLANYLAFLPARSAVLTFRFLPLSRSSVSLWFAAILKPSPALQFVLVFISLLLLC